MSDPVERLRHIDEGLDVGGALPAAEVRRRGERLRRRRTGFRVVAAACAVAVVTTGGVALGGVATDTRDSPAPPATTQEAAPEPVETSPAHGWRTGIPADFPLDRGFPADRFTEDVFIPPGPDVVAFPRVEACDETAFPVVSDVRRLGTRFEQPEYLRSRLLTTYRSGEQAAEALTRLVEVFRRCPRQSYDGPPDATTLTDVVEVGMGDKGYVVVRTYEVEGERALGLELIHAVRVGNALLLANVANEGGLTDADVNRQLDEQNTLVRALADAMCLFAAPGCG